MSGGYIDPQNQFDHQVVLFTFTGPLTRAQASRWNAAIREFKNALGLTGVTLKGQKTPPAIARGSRRGRARKRRK
jgi:hypothetical protein